MADKSNKSVVRNAQYKRGGLNKRERHNERKNADYMNDDIILERASFNVHFKQAETYAKIDPKTKRESLESVYQNPNPEMPTSWHKDKGLMKWLSDLRKQKHYAK